jgi:WD40 repeat protein
VTLAVTRRDLSNLDKPAHVVPVKNGYWAAYSPMDDQAVVMSAEDGLVAFSVADWKKTWSLPPSMLGSATTATRHGGRAVYTPDGKSLAVVSHSGTLLVLDSQTGTVKHSLRSPLGSARYCTISHNGQWIAAGGSSDSANIWDLQTGDLLTTLTGLEKFVVAMAFSPDDRRLLIGTSDDRIRLWETETGREIMQVDYLDGQEMLVGLTFTPDGRAAVAADSFGRIHVYESYPTDLSRYPGTTADPLGTRVEWLKRLERTGQEITREDVALR